MTYVADFVPRARTALDGLFEPTHKWPTAVELSMDDATPVAYELVGAVCGLHGLDPVTAEMVRGDRTRCAPRRRGNGGLPVHDDSTIEFGLAAPQPH